MSRSMRDKVPPNPMHKRPEKDLGNPPGQIVNPAPGTIRTLGDYIRQIERREVLDKPPPS